MSYGGRISQCDGKVAFDSPKLAHEVERGRSHKGGHHAKRQKRQVYRCEFCGRWHLGSPQRPTSAWSR